MKNRFAKLLLLGMLLTLLISPALAQIDVPSSFFDGERFCARVHINPDKEPVYIILDQLTIGGVPFDVTSDNFSDMWSGYPQSTEKKPLTYEFSVLLEEGSVSPSEPDPKAALASVLEAAAQQGAQASFRITLLAPKQNIVEVDCTFTGDSKQTWQQIDDIVARGDTPVESDQPYTVRAASAALGDVRFDEPVAFPLGDVDALTRYANLTVVEQRVFSIHQP